MSFDIAMSHPLGASAGQGGYGGPGMGGHQGPNWYIAYGMDLAAPAGTDVYAAFDAHLTKVQPHVAATDSGSVYGAQLFMRAPNDMMGAFYTHITDVPDGLAAGSQVSRGDFLGRILVFGGIPAHLHMALVEIIGGAPNGRYLGVDLYNTFLTTPGPWTVTFAQDGTPPTVADGDGGPAAIDVSTLRGVQQGLAALGYDPGPIDGIDGPRTRAAVAGFQSQVMQIGAPPGVVDDATRAAVADALRAAGYAVVGA
ncbi:peptidoglycan-binding protein [Granulicoccus phenolivorans]|uniref:peptidoglycan-binding protein n=1 Tax=Granulicoccus phenolivorans TaxID=266854 RepID=UPI000407730A|nr:peptidoglycan-binding protein [Granulicoccus phenolivorans]